MFSKEFETVYREAFTSATAQDIESEEVQQQYRDYATPTADALVAYWSSPTYDTTPLRTTPLDSGSSVSRIKPPLAGELTREDAEDIARIRFLGRSIIDAARQSLTENPRVTNGDEDFRSSVWYEAHPECNYGDDDLAHDPDAASPQRLREWPTGKYVNCLGVSIAMAAESENNQTPYTYVNKLRGSRQVMASQFIKHMEQFYSDFESPRTRKVDELMHLVDYIVLHAAGFEDDFAEEYAVCFRSPNIMKDTRDGYMGVDTSFHTSVLRLHDNDVAQHDPYQLVTRDAVIPNDLQTELSSEVTLQTGRMGDAERCNEIVLAEDGLEKQLAMRMAAMTAVARRATPRIEQLLNGYKSPKMMQALRNELHGVYRAMTAVTRDGVAVYDMPDEKLFDYTQHTDAAKLFDLWDILWPLYLKFVDGEMMDDFVYSSDDTALKHIFERFNLANEEREEQGNILAEAYETPLYQRIKHDSVTRKRFNDLMLLLPRMLAAYQADQMANQLLLTQDYSDAAMEIGDPAFQVGSRYMSHYARWRKGDIVNVAGELARINPSQLIWQAAVSAEHSPVTSDHVMALGSLVKSLRRNQLHPLVRITSTF